MPAPSAADVEALLIGFLRDCRLLQEGTRAELRVFLVEHMKPELVEYKGIIAAASDVISILCCLEDLQPSKDVRMEVARNVLEVREI